LATIITTIDEATKMQALKTYTLDYFEENETVESLKTIADDNGMIVMIGLPTTVFSAILGFLITCCCKKYAKCQAIGKKIKDLIVWNMVV
jgi:hypothetical protein